MEDQSCLGLYNLLRYKSLNPRVILQNILDVSKFSLSIPRHPVIFSNDDWGVQSPPQHSIYVPLPFSGGDWIPKVRQLCPSFGTVSPVFFLWTLSLERVNDDREQSHHGTVTQLQNRYSKVTFQSLYVVRRPESLGDFLKPYFECRVIFSPLWKEKQHPTQGS